MYGANLFLLYRKLKIEDIRKWFFGIHLLEIA